MPTTTTNHKPLTTKQARFVDEYVISGNASKAAIMAGYAVNSARITGCKLLTKTNIKQELSRQQAVLAKKTQYRQQDSIDRLVRYADGAEENKQFASGVSAVVAINRMFGWDKDNNLQDRVQIVINPPTAPNKATAVPCDVISSQVGINSNQPQNGLNEATGDDNAV